MCLSWIFVYEEDFWSSPKWISPRLNLTDGKASVFNVETCQRVHTLLGPHPPLVCTVEVSRVVGSARNGTWSVGTPSLARCSPMLADRNVRTERRAHGARCVSLTNLDVSRLRTATYPLPEYYQLDVKLNELTTHVGRPIQRKDVAACWWQMMAVGAE